MKQLFILFLLVCGIALAYPRPVTLPGPMIKTAEVPTVNLQPDLRQANWGGGSCVHATIVSLFRWQGRYNEADYWRKTYSGGEYAEDMAQKLDKESVRYAYTSGKNDVEFLKWACETRRGCGVTVMDGKHFVLLCELTDTDAYIMDNNSTEKYKIIPRNQFLSIWKSSGSWALTILYCPSAPLSNEDN